MTAVKELEKQLEDAKAAAAEREKEAKRKANEQKAIRENRELHDRLNPVAQALFNRLVNVFEDAKDVTVEISEWNFDPNEYGYIYGDSFFIYVKTHGFGANVIFEVMADKAGGSWSWRERDTGKVRIKVEGPAIDTKVWRPKEHTPARFDMYAEYIRQPIDTVCQSQSRFNENRRVKRDTGKLMLKAWDDLGLDTDPYSNERSGWEQTIRKEDTKKPGPPRQDNIDPGSTRLHSRLSAKAEHTKIALTIQMELDPRDADDLQRFRDLVQAFNTGTLTD